VDGAGGMGQLSVRPGIEEVARWNFGAAGLSRTGPQPKADSNEIGARNDHCTSISSALSEPESEFNE
jgi:hypothetical protein